MSDLPKIENILDEIWQDLHSSMESLENGGSIDMASIDGKVRSFCEEITELPPEQLKQYNEKLPPIIEYLNNIVDKLNKQKSAMEVEFGGLEQRTKAHNAYGQTLVNNKPYNETT